MGLWQATARYNSFIPFYSVDGHSVCCDIDEACGTNAQDVVSMENCVAIFYANSPFRSNEVYWTKGATYRVEAAKEELQFRSRRTEQNLVLL
jgi:hypothetical protein